MSRIRQQVFLVGLMVAFAAVSSAMAPISLGRNLRRRASDRSQRILRHTRRRFVRARALMRRRAKPALDFIARVRAA